MISRNVLQTPPLPFRQVWFWVSLVSLLFLLNYSARSLLSPLLAYVEQDLRIGHVQATSLLLAQGLGFATTQTLCGFLVGLACPARVAGLSIVGSGLCLLCLPLARDLVAAQLLFLLLGCTAGVYFPAGMAILGSLVIPKDWGKAVSIHELAPSLTFILTPLLAQAALNIVSWRGVFALMGGVMTIIGILFLLFGRGGKRPLAPPSFKGSIDILRLPATWVIFSLLAVTISGEFAVFSVLQLYLVHDVGFSSAQGALLLTMTRLATPFAVVLGGWLTDNYAPLPILRLCLLGQALGLGLMTPGYALPALGGSCLQALCIALVFPALFKAVSSHFPLHLQPLLFSLVLPPASLIATGAIPWFLGFCGEYASFGLGFSVLGVLSCLCLPALPLLHPTTAHDAK